MQEADSAREAEKEQRIQAEQKELEARRLLYAADMRDVGRALDDEEFGQAKRLMQRQASQKNLQGWEWRHLWLKTQGGKREQLASNSQQNGHSMTVSVDGKWLACGTASVGGQNALGIWDLESGQQLSSSPEVKYGRVRTAFSPAANVLAYNSQESAEGKKSQIHLWDADKNEMIDSFPLNGTCEGIHFSPDGTKLLVANQVFGSGGRIIKWDISKKSIISSVYAPDMMVFFSRWESFAIDGMARYAAYATTSAVNVIGLDNGNIFKTIPAEGNINAVAMSPDGNLTIVSSGYHQNHESGPVLWDVSTGEKLSMLLGHVDAVTEIAFWPDGKTIATSSLDQSIRLWDISNPRSPELIQVLRGHEAWVTQLVLTPDQASLISCGGGDLFVWDLAWDDFVLDEVLIKGVVGKGFGFTYNGKDLIAIEEMQVVKRSGRTYQDSEVLFEINELSYQRNVQFSEDANFLAVGSDDGNATLWNVSKRQAFKSKVGEGFVRIVHVRNDGVAVLEVSGSGGSTARQLIVHDLRQSKVLSSITLYHGMQAFAAYSPDDRFSVLTNSSDDLVGLVQDRGTLGSEAIIYKGGVITRACFSPDGNFLAIRTHAGRNSGAVRVYDTKTFEQKSLFSSLVPITNWSLLAFSPDSRRFVTGGGKRHGLQLWDVETGQPVLSLGTEYSDFHYAAFSPDDQWLGCTTEAGLKLWRAPSREEIEETETLAMK